MDLLPYTNVIIPLFNAFINMELWGNHLVFYMGWIFMLYNQLLESISIEATVGTLRLSTPTYIPYDLQSSIKKLIPSPLLPLQAAVKIVHRCCCSPFSPCSFQFGSLASR